MSEELQYHPLTSAYRELSADEQRALANDIKAHGLQVPIVLYDGMILDGRHRYQACLTENVEPQFVEFTGADPAGEVLSLNGIRRHASLEDRKKAFDTLIDWQPEMTDRALAKATGLRRETVAKYREEKTEELPNVRNRHVEPREPLPRVTTKKDGSKQIPPGRKADPSRKYNPPARTPDQLRQDKLDELVEWLKGSEERVWDLVRVLSDTRPKQAKEMVRKLATAWGVASALAA